MAVGSGRRTGGMGRAALLAGVLAVALPFLAPLATASTVAAGAVSPAAGDVVRAVRPGGRPFAVVDKVAATLTVYHADGRIAGRSPALLGRTLGDRSAPGVGERTQQGRLRPEDLTTPAGRFVSEPGRNRHGEAVVWVDYDAAFAIHRLRADGQHADRARRLASPRPQDRRASAGCVVVPVAFFETVVLPVLGRGRGVVLVLPEGPGEADETLALR